MHMQIQWDTIAISNGFANVGAKYAASTSRS